MGYQLLLPANKFLPIVIRHGDKANGFWEESKKNIMQSHRPLWKTATDTGVTRVCWGTHEAKELWTCDMKPQTKVIHSSFILGWAVSSNDSLHVNFKCPCQHDVQFSRTVSPVFSLIFVTICFQSKCTLHLKVIYDRTSTAVVLSCVFLHMLEIA